MPTILNIDGNAVENLKFKVDILESCFEELLSFAHDVDQDNRKFDSWLQVLKGQFNRFHKYIFELGFDQEAISLKIDRCYKCQAKYADEIGTLNCDLFKIQDRISDLESKEKLYKYFIFLTVPSLIIALTFITCFMLV